MEENNNIENEIVKENNNIVIEDEVIATIAGIAVSEVSGVAEMAGGFAGGITEVLSGKKNLAKGIKVETKEGETKIDVNIIVEYGVRIPDVAFEIQNKVKKSVEEKTGLKVSGVNVIKTQIMVYAIAGMMYAFAAALEVGRIGSASNTTGNGYEMDAVAACVIGGVSLSGGVGSVGGIVIGVLMFTVINYGLAFIGVNMYWQYIVKGLIILLAVIIDMRKYAKRK